MNTIIKPSIIFFLLSFVTLLGEGWTKKAGKGFYAIDFRILSSTKFHNSSGDNIDIPRINDLALNLYSEYGITDNFTLKLNFPFYKMLDTDSFSNSIDPNNSGIGDIDIGMRYKLKNFGKTVLAVSLSFGIPLSSEEDNKGKFALGDGEFNQNIGVEIGHSLYPKPAYLSGSLKFNNRNEGFSDQFMIGMEAGYKPLKNLLINGRISYLKSLKNGPKKVLPSTIPIHSNNQEYVAVKVGAFYNFYKNVGLAATTNLGIYAKNILSAPVFSLGIYIK